MHDVLHALCASVIHPMSPLPPLVLHRLRHVKSRLCVARLTSRRGDCAPHTPDPLHVQQPQSVLPLLPPLALGVAADLAAVAHSQ
jgi:hypothetical protein